MVSIMVPGLQFNFVDDTVCGLIEIESFYCANYFRAYEKHSRLIYTLLSETTYLKAFKLRRQKLWLLSNKSCLLAYYLLPIFTNKSEIIKLRLT